MTESVAPEVPCARIHEGDVLEPVQIPVTRETLVRYAGASTDFNPIHWSDRAARAAGMDGVIAHGMWTMGAALGVVVHWVADPGRVVSQRARFVRPVLVPDTDEGTQVIVSGRVTKADDQTATLSLDVTHEGQTVLGRVEIVITQENS